VVETWILLQILNGVKTGNELKNVLRVDMALIQRSCDRLVKKKWVVRTVDSYDRRVKILSLSKDGRSLIRRLIRYSQETNAKALSPLDEKQQDVLRHLLISIFKRLTGNISEF
jgi:DNA-binding MarR family transcriptional regulator